MIYCTQPGGHLGRWIGIDYGTRRVGLAVADPGGRLAFPAAVLPAAPAPADTATRILAWAADQDPAGFVVGLPLNMDGSAGPQARLSGELAGELRARSALPVRLWDERLSTFEADQRLLAAEVRRSRRKRLRDALAAQVILQSFLDAGCPPTTGEDCL